MATNAVFAALLLLSTAYSNFFHNEFHFDDNHVLVENLYVRSLHNLPKFFTDANTFSRLPANATYRPICSLSLAVDYAIAGRLDPRVFHASQFGQMMLLWLALIVFYRRAMDAVTPHPTNHILALFAATLFAVHTLHTETMNLMHARSEILSALGLVGAFLIYWRGGLPRRLGLHVVAMVVGALAKPPALIFGPLLFLWTMLDPHGAGETVDGSGVRSRWRTALRISIVPTLIGGIVGVLIARMDAPRQSYGGSDWVHYLLTQVWAWLHYVRLLILPLGLTADTDLQLIQNWYDTRVFAGGLMIAGMAWVAARSARSAHGWLIAFGLGWFALGLAPASSIVPLAEPVNEHRPFLGTIGILLAAVWGLRMGVSPRFASESAGSRWRPIGAAAAGVLLLLAHTAGTFERNKVWRTQASLWQDVTQRSPRNGRGWMNYGLSFMKSGDLSQARQCFERALALTPNYYILEINLGVLEGAAKNPFAAEAHFLRALALEPKLPDPPYYFGRWLIGQGRAPEAIKLLETATQIAPGFESAVDLLVDLLAARGEWPEVRRRAEISLLSAPGNAKLAAYSAGRMPTAGDYQSRFDRGFLLGQQNRWLASALEYRAALEVVPTAVDALTNLGWTLGKLGLFTDAATLLEHALALQPTNALARNNLAWVKGEAERTAIRNPAPPR